MSTKQQLQIKKTSNQQTSGSQFIPTKSQAYDDQQKQPEQNSQNPIRFSSDLSPVAKRYQEDQMSFSNNQQEIINNHQEYFAAESYDKQFVQARQNNVKCDQEYYQDFELPLENNTPGKALHKERSQSYFEGQQSSSAATPQTIAQCRQATQKLCGHMLAMSGMPIQQYANIYKKKKKNNHQDNNDAVTPQNQRQSLSIKSQRQQQQFQDYYINYDNKKNKKSKNGIQQQSSNSQKSRKKIVNCNDSLYSIQQRQQLQQQIQKRQGNYSLNRMQHTIKAYFPKKQQANKFKSNIKKIRSTSVVAPRMVLASSQSQSQKGFGMIQAFKNDIDENEGNDDEDDRYNTHNIDTNNIRTSLNYQSDQQDCENMTPYNHKSLGNTAQQQKQKNQQQYSCTNSLKSQQRNLIDFDSLASRQIRRQSTNSKSKKTLSNNKIVARQKINGGQLSQYKQQSYNNNIYVPLSKQLNIQRHFAAENSDLPPIVRQNSAGVRPRITASNNNSSKFSPTKKNHLLNGSSSNTTKRSLLVQAGKMQIQNKKVLVEVNNNSNNRIYIPPPTYQSRSPSSLISKTTTDSIKNSSKTNKKDQNQQGIIAGSALNAVRAQSSRRPKKVIPQSVTQTASLKQNSACIKTLTEQQILSKGMSIGLADEEIKTPMGGSGTTADGNDQRQDTAKSGSSTPSKTVTDQNFKLFSPQNPINKLDPIKEKPPQPKIDFQKRHIDHLKALAEKKKVQNMMIQSQRKKMVETRERLRKMILNRAERRKKQVQEQSVLQISRITDADSKSPERKGTVVHARNSSASYTSPILSKQKQQQSVGGTTQTYEKTQEQKDQEEKQKKLELQKLKKYYRSRYATMLQMIKDNLKSKKQKEQREQEMQHQKKMQLREQLGVASVQSRFMKDSQKKPQDTPIQTSEKKRASTSMPPAPLRSKTFYKESSSVSTSSSSVNKRLQTTENKVSDDQSILNSKALPSRAKDDSDLHPIKQATGSRNKQVSQRLFQKHQQFLQQLAKKKAKQKQAAEQEKKRKDKMKQNIREIVKSQNASEIQKRIKTKKQIRQEEQQKLRKEQELKKKQVKDPKKIAQANQNFLQRNMVIKKPTNKIFINDMAQWKKRNKIDEHTKVFVCNGGYGELKKALRERKWVENKDVDSPCFDLKWTLKARQVTQDQLLPHQIVNHFDKNTAITTKVGLCHNLKNLIWFENVDIDQFYPRGFDLLEGGELDDFIEEFKIVKAESILKMYFMEMKKKLNSANKINQKQIDENKVTVALNICQRRCMDLDQLIDDPTAEHVTLVTKAEWDILSTDQKTAYDIAVQKHQNFLARINAKYGQKKNKKKAKGANNSVSIAADILKKKATTGSKNLSMLEDYGIPLDQNQEEETKQPENKLLTRVEALLEQMKKKFPQFSLNGVRNMWILKPAGLSRGRGIQVFNSLNQILEYTKNKQQQWVVQKYIQNPLIVHDHKFDIRQWVLVTDWNPLTIWFYNKCYVRFSAKKYNPNVLGNKYIHLTNNSILKSNNKQIYDIEEDIGQGLMWDCSDFQQWLQNKFGFDIWEEQLQPQLKDIVTLSLKSVQDMVQNRKNSFEFFGYDFMVDDQGVPWLIEVNSSPAMDYSTEVTEHLVKEGLRDTAKVIVDYHFASNKKKPHIDTGDWELIYKSKKQVERPMNSFGLNLFVEGKRILRS